MNPEPSPRQPQGRTLTQGEIAMARKIFGDSIDYTAVRVHARKFVFFQPQLSGMTPNGEIYAAGLFRADYTMAEPSLKSFFIHEMAHVWQFQQKVLNPVTEAVREQIKHRFNYVAAYLYRLEPGKTLTDFGMEQQASIIEDYYRMTCGHGWTGVFCQNAKDRGQTQASLLALFSATLEKFLADPSFPSRKPPGHSSSGPPPKRADLS